MNMLKIIVAAAACMLTTIAAAQRSTPIELLHFSPAAAHQFGHSVAIDGDTAVIGALLDDPALIANAGSALVYRWTGTTWQFEARLTAMDASAGQHFGDSVAICGDTVVIGTMRAAPGQNEGAAYVFTRSGATWTQQAKLLASDGEDNDGFGFAVAIADDTLIVGARHDVIGASVGQGSAYVFTRSGVTWTQQAKLVATDGAAGDLFGFSVAISGDTALVGAPDDNVGANTDQGSAYIFARSGVTWTQQAKLTASDGAPESQFGSAVAMAGDTALVGALGDDQGGLHITGSAYVFIRAGSTWSQQAQLTAADGGSFDRFGASVAISGNTVIVGAPGDSLAGNVQGSAHVFVRSGSTWSRQAKFPSSGGVLNDGFGGSVAISGDVAVVGASLRDGSVDLGNMGSAWVFSRVGSNWIGPDLSMLAADGASDDFFGISVASSGDTVVVGAFGDDVGGNVNQGSAYVFIKSGAAWIQQAKLTAADGEAEDFFGFSVAISGDTLVVGAYSDDVGGNTTQGSAYVFTRSGGSWTQQAKLVGAGGASTDLFGQSVAIDGDTVVVGARLSEAGGIFNRGSAYVFVRVGSLWIQQARLNAADASANDFFGHSVAIDGNTVVVGAMGDDVGTSVDQGSAYVFTRSGATWTQQARVTEGVSGDSFGSAVAIDGNSIIVGAVDADEGSVVDRGAAYVFTRSGTTWTLQSRLLGSGFAPGDDYGFSVAIEGDIAVVGAPDEAEPSGVGSARVFVRTGVAWSQRARLTMPGSTGHDCFGASVVIRGPSVMVGAYCDSIGANFRQGSAWSIDLDFTDLSAATNASTGVVFGSVASAVASALSGQSIVANEGAWRQAATVDTAGRSIAFTGQHDIRTPSGSVVTLTNACSMTAPAGAVIDINGQLRAGGQVALHADDFRLGSRGVMTLLANASLSINAPTADLDGQVRVASGSSLAFAGGVRTIGPTVCDPDATISAGSSFVNIDAFTISAGSVATPRFRNHARFIVLDSSEIVGSFVNDFLATTSIDAGTLRVSGNLTNNGRIVGADCSACPGLPPSIDVGGAMVSGAAAELTMPSEGSTFDVGASFDCAIDANTRFDMARALLRIESSRDDVTLEVMSRDRGPERSGLDRSIAGHFPVGTLHIGPSSTTVRLVDAHDNALDGAGTCEALYVDTLRIDAGSRLINAACRIYYNTLVNNGVVDVRENLIRLESSPCPADFNRDGGVDGGDVVDFFAAWEGGESSADVNEDGGVDGSDTDVFFAAWEAGGC